MDLPNDILINLVCYLSDIKSAFRLSLTTKKHYNIFNENRVWFYYLYQLIKYEERHHIFLINEKETYKRCFKISNLIKKIGYFDDSPVNMFIKKEIFINYKQLTMIPSELGQLADLQKLSLSQQSVDINTIRIRSTI